MNLRTLLFDTTRSDNPLSSSTSNDPNPGEQKQIADFLTLQSLSFPAASAGVVIVWQVIQKVFTGGWTTNNVIPLLIAAIIVYAAYLYAWPDLGSAPRRMGAFLIALVNTGLLAAASLGVTKL